MKKEKKKLNTKYVNKRENSDVRAARTFLWLSRLRRVARSAGRSRCAYTRGRAIRPRRQTRKRDGGVRCRAPLGTARRPWRIERLLARLPPPRPAARGSRRFRFNGSFRGTLRRPHPGPHRSALDDDGRSRAPRCNPFLSNGAIKANGRWKTGDSREAAARRAAYTHTRAHAHTHTRAAGHTPPRWWGGGEGKDFFERSRPESHGTFVCARQWRSDCPVVKSS